MIDAHGMTVLCEGGILQLRTFPARFDDFVPQCHSVLPAAIFLATASIWGFCVIAFEHLFWRAFDPILYPVGKHQMDMGVGDATESRVRRMNCVLVGLVV